jgi:hypothetical protein
MTLPPLNSADKTALDAVIAVRPVWRSLKRAGTAIGLKANTLLHAGPAFGSPAEITKPIFNSACIAAVIDGIAGDFEAAGEAIGNGEIILRPAQDYGVVTPLAAVVSASMWLHEVVDANDPARVAFAPINGGNGPAMRLGICNDDVLAHIRWLNGPFAETLAAVHNGDIDLIALAAHGLSEGDDCHGRTIAATAELIRQFEPAIDHEPAARQFLDEGPSFFLNLWMAACKCMFAAAVGIFGSSAVTAAGGNGATSGIQVAGTPGRWYTAPAAVPNGDLGDMPDDRALGAIGDSAIVDVAGFGAMAMSYAPAQQEGLGGYMPDNGLSLPELLFRRVHPGFGDLGFRTGLCACDVVASGRSPVISLGVLDVQGTAGRLGGGIYQTPMEPFAAAVEQTAAEGIDR